MNTGKCVFLLVIEPGHILCLLHFEFIDMVKSEDENVASLLAPALPKYWHNYITLFFDKKQSWCHNINSHSNNFPHVIWCLLQYADIFQSDSKVIVTPIEFANRKVAKPSGQISAQFDGIFCGEECQCCSDLYPTVHIMCCRITKRHSWKFILLSKFLVNFTFHKIYFSVPKKLITYAHLKISVALSKSRVFRFCCQLSSFNFYPPGHRFLTEVSTITTELSYKINASFMVNDKNVKENVPISHSNTVQYFLTYKINYHTEQYLWIVTKKSEHLIIAKNTHRNCSCVITVMDGPGILSQKLTSRNQTYISSTFQSFVQVISFKNSVESLAYHSHTLKVVIREHIARDTDFLVPNQKCNFSNPCVASMQAPNHSPLKVTVKNMSYGGFPSLDCQYGGLSLLYTQSRKLFELLTACDK